jgi:hypothetical protein
MRAQLGQWPCAFAPIPSRQSVWTLRPREAAVSPRPRSRRPAAVRSGELQRAEDRVSDGNARSLRFLQIGWFPNRQNTYAAAEQISQSRETSTLNSSPRKDPKWCRPPLAPSPAAPGAPTRAGWVTPSRPQQPHRLVPLAGSLGWATVTTQEQSTVTPPTLAIRFSFAARTPCFPTLPANDHVPADTDAGGEARLGEAEANADSSDAHGQRVSAGCHRDRGAFSSPFRLMARVMASGTLSRLRDHPLRLALY